MSSSFSVKRIFGPGDPEIKQSAMEVIQADKSPDAPWTAIQLGNYGSKVRIQAMVTGIKALGGGVVAAMDSTRPTLLSLTQRPGILFAFTAGNHSPEAWARGILRSRGIQLLSMDLGYINRARDGMDREGYTQIGVGGPCQIPEGPLPDDRFQALGVKLGPMGVERPRVALLLGQVPNDGQHELTEQQLRNWLTDRAGFWQAEGYSLRFRAHPQLPGQSAPCVQGLEIRSPQRESLEQALAGAGVVVTYNSTAGLQAILAGLPVDSAPAAHYFQIGSCGNSSDPRARAMVQAHLNRVAYAQWTLPEIEAGIPLRWMAANSPPMSKLQPHLNP
jgi:hypothetical protein